MALFTFPDGRWVRLRPMYVLDELAFDELASLGDDLETARAGLREASERLGAAASDDDKAAAMAEAVDRMEAFQRAYQAQLRAVYDRMRDATEETSWGAELGARVTSEELAQLSLRWRQATGDQTLPPV